MNDITLTIILGIVASAIYSILAKICSLILHHKEYKPEHQQIKIHYSLKTLRCQFYISLAIVVICCMLLKILDTSSFIGSCVQIVFFLALFMLWSAFECMAETYSECIDIIKKHSANERCDKDNNDF